jgi:hypothetical protein
MDHLILGFTGTRKGMTSAQASSALSMIRSIAPKELTLHHGDCIGADAQMHEIAQHIIHTPDRARPFGGAIMLHPPKADTFRAFCGLADDHFTRIEDNVIWYTEEGYLERDRRIVWHANVMFATPRGFKPIQRGSGTWYTANYALEHGKPLYIIWPDGLVTQDSLSYEEAEPLPLTEPQEGGVSNGTDGR